MQNFIKTILNAVQAWTKKEIKKSKADWSQNDPSADNYVKNRTHWEETNKVVFVPEMEIVLDGEPLLNAFDIEFIEGKTYTVIWDGVTYNCVAYIAEGPNTPSIGNGAGVGTSGGNGEPFFCTVFDGNVMLFGFEGAHTIQILLSETVTHKLDPKYLPEDTATKLEVAYAVEQAMEAEEKAENAIEEALNAQIMAEGKISMPSSGELNQILAVTESVDGVPTKIECIDASKDWEQYDETKIDYIRNRTHYYNVTTYVSAINQSGGIDLAPVGYIKDRKKYLHENSVFRIIINGVENIISTKYWIGDEGQVTTASKIFWLNADGWTLAVGITLKIHRASGAFLASISFNNQDKEIICSAYYEQRDVKLLDEKYLPTTIARVSDIPSIEGLATEEYVDEALAGFEGNGAEEVYILAEGENIENAPQDAKLIIDPNGSTDVGSVVQADWNATEGEAGHILNKPFGSVIGEVLPECSPLFDGESDDPIFYLMQPFAIPLSEGCNYTVKWNGTEWNTTAFGFSDGGIRVNCIGNGGMLGVGEDTGEPFFIMEQVPELAAEMGIYGMIMPLDGTTELTISIMGEVVQKIDEKYLPDGKSAFLYGGSDNYIYATEDTSNPANRMTMIGVKKVIESGKQVYLVVFGGTADVPATLYLLPVFAFTEQYGVAYTMLFGQSATAKQFYTAEYEQ